MKDLTDKRYALTDLRPEIDAEALCARLRSAVDDEARYAALTSFVTATQLPPSRHEEAVAACVRLMIETKARVRSDQLADASGLSVRTLERSFLDVVGISSRTLASVFRVRQLFETLQAEPSADLTQLALAADWFDHPHMSRDFRRFVGCTPSQFMRNLPGLAAGLATGDPDRLSQIYKRRRGTRA